MYKEYEVAHNTFYGVDQGTEYIRYHHKNKQASEDFFVEFNSHKEQSDKDTDKCNMFGIPLTDTIKVYKLIKKNNVFNKIREKLGKLPKIEKEDIHIYNASKGIKRTAEKYMGMEDMDGMGKIISKAHALIVEKGRSVAETDLLKDKINEQEFVLKARNNKQKGV